MTLHEEIGMNKLSRILLTAINMDTVRYQNRQKDDKFVDEVFLCQFCTIYMSQFEAAN